MRKTLVPFMLVATLGVTACGRPSRPIAPSAPPIAAESPTVTPLAPQPNPPPAIKWYVKSDYGPVKTDDPAGKTQKVVVLTFDDGPDPVITPKILDTLKQNNVKAIFFMTAKAGLHPELVQRVEAEGHIVGTHTANHSNLRQLSLEKQREEIVTANEIVKKVLGHEPRYFRPPFGAYNANTETIMKELKMKLLTWDHGSGDWMDVKNGYKDPQILVQDVLAETPRNNQMTPLHDGAVILMHDTLKHTAEALPDVIKGLRAKGYDFVIPVADPDQAPK